MSRIFWLRLAVLLLGISALSPCSASPVVSDEPSPAADSYIIHQWTTVDGLPVNYIGDIVQGEKGYLWLRGGGGLVRFDGREFKVFTQTDLPGWQTSYVESLYKDREGDLWLVSRRGTLTRYRKGQFYTYDWTAQHPKRMQYYEGGGDGLWISSGTQVVHVAGKTTIPHRLYSEQPGDKIKGFHEGEQGRLWAFSTGGLFRRKGKSFVAVDTARVFQQIIKREAGGVWSVTGRGLFHFQGGRFTKSSLDLAPSDSVTEIYEDSRGHLWVGMHEGQIIRVDRTEKTVYTPTDGSARASIAEIYEQSTGRMWVDLGKQGLFYLAAGRFRNVGLDEYQSPPEATGFEEGPQGNLWVGMGAGLFRLSPRAIQGYTRAEGLPTDLIFPILQDNEGAVWMGTNGAGLHRLADGRMAGPKLTISTADGLPGNEIFSLHESRGRGIWVGGRRAVARVAGNSVEERHFLGREGGRIRALYEDERGRVWVGRQDLFLIDEDSVRRHGPPLLRRGNVSVRGIHEDQSGTVWVTTKEGLFRKNDEEWRRFTTEDGLPSNFLLSVHEEADGTLWFTTHGAGLIRYLGDEAFFSITTAEGLHSNGIWQILEDGRGHFWMSSNTGLFRVRKRALERLRRGTIDRISSRVFTVADGMPSSECAHTQPAGWKTQDGSLWFPTIKGAAIVDPDNVPAADGVPPVRLQQVRADGRQVDWRTTDVLRPGGNTLAFHYAALNFSAPEQSRYRYKLEGYDETWQQAGARRTALYTNLPPGQYRFRVQARTGSGGGPRGEASFAFTLQPYFWQTAWFYLLCVVGLVGLFYGVHRLRLKHVREQELERKVEQRTQALREEKEKTEEQAERLEALDEARRRLFRDLSHELRTPLTMISTPLHTVLADLDGALPEDARELLEAAHRNSKQLEDLVDRVMELSRLETGRLSLEARSGDLVAFARETTRSFEPMAERNDVQLHFRTDPDQLSGLFDPEKLRSAMGNLIENALQYTPEGGKVLVRVEHPDEQTAALRVSDTGPGIPEDEKSDLFKRFHQRDTSRGHCSDGTGLGLALAKELTELHGGTIEVESEPGMGSTFTVCLPRRVSEARPETDPDETSPEMPSVSLEGNENARGVSPSTERSSSGSPESRAASTETAPTVLVVEDNADVRTYLRAQLSEEYCIQEAQDGQEALDRARAEPEPPDLILSDVMMPGMDGMELCRRIKSDDALRDVPVLLLTAKAGDEAEVEGLDAGDDAYVEKPFSMGTLRARIQNLIDARAVLRDQYCDEVAIEPSGISVTPEEEKFYEEARAVVEAHIGEAGFTVEQFAGDLSVSRSTLRRRLKDATGQTPAEFVRHLRLERAAQLLQEDEDLRVYQLADAVGYESPDHFSRLFRDHFGVAPSEYPAEGTD